MRLDLFLGHKSDAIRPASWGIVQDIENVKSRGVFVSQFIKFLLEEDIFVVDIGINEAQLCTIVGVFERSADDLEHGGNACAPSNHADFT